MEQDETIQNECGKTIMAINDTMDILGGKWKISIIACLCYSSMRYSEILKKVRGISGKVLSRELKELEINGLIIRKVLNEGPIAVEYSISDYGKSLKELTLTIADWGLNHRQFVIKGMAK
ncbi:helix-turn-helix domain-containing protein [Sphingobacterium sp.]|uniref:winged helix-turn-helix transcriptional regulator n=1 Tax=Sphingobacterium sp. TaxID=341027 RepID=UPI00289CB3B4|nr:helix-turn-helix domain-containing protein [Sphingobacterium sp.]